MFTYVTSSQFHTLTGVPCPQIVSSILNEIICGHTYPHVSPTDTPLYRSVARRSVSSSILTVAPHRVYVANASCK